jgi:hypothetical protein
MQRHTKLVMGALIAALMLSAAVTTASARRFEFSNQRFLAIWEGVEPLIFGAGGQTIRCDATIEGSFHSRTISKVCGQLVGYVTEARIAHPCEIGDAWFQNGIEEIPGEGRTNTLPWHIRFESFTGVLPRITGIRLQVINMAWLLHNELWNCLYKSTAAKPAFGILRVNEVTGLIETWRWDEMKSIPLFLELRSTFPCPEISTLTHAGQYFVQRSLTRVIVRLVQ